MLLRYWRSYSEAGRVIVCAAVLAVTLAVLVTVPDLLGGPRASEKDPDAHAQAAQRHWQPHFSPTEAYAPYHNADCQSPKDREEADLCQQWRVAEATEKAVAVAEGQFRWNVAQAIGAIAAALAAAWAAFAAARAARAAEATVEVQRRIEQPLLVPEAMTYRVETPLVVFGLRNFGKSPAILRRHFALFSVSGRPPDIPQYEATPFDYAGEVLESNADRQGFAAQIMRNGLVRRPHDPDGTIYLWGCILYDDVFGRSKRTGYGMRGEYNRLLREYIWRRFGDDAYNYDREETNN